MPKAAKLIFRVIPLTYLGASSSGKLKEAKMERHWPTVLSMPKDTARWLCEPVLFDCQDIILYRCEVQR